MASVITKFNNLCFVEETMYLSRQGLRLKNETIGAIIIAITLTLKRIKATGHGMQRKH